MGMHTVNGRRETAKDVCVHGQVCHHMLALQSDVK